MFETWWNYFQNNRSHFQNVDSIPIEYLTTDEYFRIAFSIAQFQRGESSEGKNLMRGARKWGIPWYVETVTLFIREEQRHAAVLLRFMEANGIPKLQSHWVDDIFRWLRKHFSYRVTIRTLLTAELAAQIYYDALERATFSGHLKAVCRQILTDEIAHVRFQCDTLGRLESGMTPFHKNLTAFGHRILMAGTALVVWIYHHRVFAYSGISFGILYRQLQAKLAVSEIAISSSDSSTSSILSKAS